MSFSGVVVWPSIRPRLTLRFSSWVSLEVKGLADGSEVVRLRERRRGMCQQASNNAHKPELTRKMTKSIKDPLAHEYRAHLEGVNRSNPHAPCAEFDSDLNWLPNFNVSQRVYGQAKKVSQK